LVGGAAALGALYFTALTLQTSQATLRTTQEGQITDRFTKAIDLLGKSPLDIRLGAIYALARIADDSPTKDYWPIMEILTAYVRVHARWRPSDAQPVKDDYWLKEEQQGEKREEKTDIQAILTILVQRRWVKEEKQKLILHNTDLRGAKLAEVKLAGADLAGV